MVPKRRDAACDQTATLAVHCGNGLDAGFRLLPKYQSGPIQCSPLLKCTLQRREFITLLGGLRPGRHIAHISVQKQRINGGAMERAHI
jgi:hypothetical protein